MKNLIVIAPYDPQWPLEFRRLGTSLRSALGDLALRIDHIGSTAVPGLSAKDVIDVQITVATLDKRALVAAISTLGYRFWDDITSDHLPPGRTDAPEEWSKLYFSAPAGQQRTNLHVRQAGRANQRYALLFRDYLRADPGVSRAYARIKEALARLHPEDFDGYYDVKDPSLLKKGDLKTARLLPWLCFLSILADGYPDFCTSRRFAGNSRCLSQFRTHTHSSKEVTQKGAFSMSTEDNKANVGGDELMGDPRSLLHGQVSELLAVEGDVQEALDGQSKLDLLDPDLQAELRTIRAQAVSQRQGLENYLRANGVEPTISSSPIASLLQPPSSPHQLSHLLSADYAAFNYAAHRYSVLVELALRLYDPALRELAPKHLSTYTRAARLFNHVLPTVIVGELNRAGLECHCICPMCSIGACGCMAAGRHFINTAWRESEPEINGQPGFLLTAPRRDSQLAQSGVRAGDRLLEIDGQVIKTFIDVQAAIRKHEIGGEVVFRIARGLEPPRDIRVRHVSDYSPG